MSKKQTKRKGAKVLKEGWIVHYTDQQNMVHFIGRKGRSSKYSFTEKETLLEVGHQEHHYVPRRKFDEIFQGFIFFPTEQMPSCNDFKEIPLNEVLDLKNIEHDRLKKSPTHFFEIKTSDCVYYIGKAVFIFRAKFIFWVVDDIMFLLFRYSLSNMEEYKTPIHVKIEIVASFVRFWSFSSIILLFLSTCFTTMFVRCANMKGRLAFCCFISYILHPMGILHRLPFDFIDKSVSFFASLQYINRSFDISQRNPFSRLVARINPTSVWAIGGESFPKTEESSKNRRSALKYILCDR